MMRTGSTKERKRAALERLASGPWPVRFSWGLFHDRETHLAQINAMRTLRSLQRAGVVERIVDTDRDRTELWRLA